MKKKKLSVMSYVVLLYVHYSYHYRYKVRVIRLWALVKSWSVKVMLKFFESNTFIFEARRHAAIVTNNEIEYVYGLVNYAQQPSFFVMISVCKH